MSDDASLAGRVSQANQVSIEAGAEVSLVNTELSAANSLSLVMSNAATTQQGSQQIAQAAVAVTCQLIIKSGVPAT